MLILATPVLGAGPSIEFGRCLTRQGAVFYGTSWCPNCRVQRKLLGRAMSYVPYVECSVGGDHDRTAAACKKADIKAYPTWTFGDGSRVHGSVPLEKLASLTGCELDGTAGEDYDETDENGVRRRKIGGALIIDVPQ